jgi:hypothetical protein
VITCIRPERWRWRVITIRVAMHIDAPRERYAAPRDGRA